MEFWDIGEMYGITENTLLNWNTFLVFERIALNLYTKYCKFDANTFEVYACALKRSEKCDTCNLRVIPGTLKNKILLLQSF